MASLTDVTDAEGTNVHAIPRAAQVVAVGAALTVVTVLELVRQRGVPVWNSLWAEDGRVFLSDALRDFPGTFLAQNGGYVHVVPRSVAGIVTLVPITDAAAGMAIGAAAVIGLVAGFVYLASAELIRSRAARLALAATVAFVPVPGTELLANTTNLHFYLLFGCFWALVWQSETLLAVTSRSAMAAAAALSDPLCVLFLPLAVVGPAVRRTRRSLTVSCLYGAALLVQVAIIAGGTRPERNWGFRLGALPDIFSLRVAGGLVVGDRFLRDAWEAYGRGFAYGALVLVATVVAALAIRSDRRGILFVLIALGYAGLFFCVQLFGRGTGGMDPEWHGFQLNGARYILLPFFLVTAVILVLADRVAGTRPGRSSRVIQSGTLLWVMVLVAANFSVTTDRSRGPRWDHELALARRVCAKTPRHAANVLVAPAPPRVWYATIPCTRL
ncbi:MAG TPA: hypothetical protein VFJ93_01315 [Gaiellaceae bacterium]|nr:hypothetical protein [Gaiellaceae bacterium]